MVLGNNEFKELFFSFQRFLSTLLEVSTPLSLSILIDLSFFLLVSRYFRDNLWLILKILLKVKSFATTLLLKKSQNKFLKTQFPNIYQSKTYIEYYNFCQKFKDYFAIAQVMNRNCISFVESFFYDQALFYQEQHKYTLRNEITMLIL